MDKRIFVAVGVADLLVTLSLLALFGVDAVVASPVNFGMYAGLLLAGVSAVLGGFGLAVGPLSWRGFVGATYLFISAITVGTFLIGDVAAYSSIPKLVYGVLVLVSTATFLAIGTDIALNGQRLVRVQ